MKLISDLKLKFDSAELESETSRGKTPVVLAIKNEVLGGPNTLNAPPPKRGAITLKRRPKRADIIAPKPTYNN